MKKITVKVNEQKNKLLKILCNNVTNISYSNLNKILRKKDIKVNGERVIENIDVFYGDLIEIYFPESILTEAKTSMIKVIYEDSNIIIIDKQRGKEVINDKGYDILADVNEYLKSSTQKAKPVHRLDKSTSGLLIFAKTDTAEKELLKAFKDRTIKKFYTCTIVGVFPYKDITKKAYLKKDSKNSKVYISDISKSGYEQIITRFISLKKSKTNTDLEVELITGKTHQIRAHLAHLGFPIVGDEKYGNGKGKFNLTSSKIIFSFQQSSPLYYLNGKQIKLK